MATKKLDLRNPVFHDDDKAREHLESVALAAKSGLPTLRRHGRSSHQAAGQEHPPRRLQVQGLP